MKLSPEAKRIERLISKAFEAQALGDGIGMREADAYDDWAPPETVAAARSQDERNRWEDLNPEEVRRYCEFGWHFFDAAGLAFHLPAMLRAELHEEGDDYLAFRLGDPNKQRDLLWDKLTRQQRLAVREFLVWATANAVFESDRGSYLQGLTEFWTLERIEQGRQTAASDGDHPLNRVHTFSPPPDSL